MEFQNLILGESPQMQEVVQIISRVVNRRWASVLIHGETGTGKGIVARAIHNGTMAQLPNSQVEAGEASAAGAFIDVNCAAIPDNLLEAELFGYKPGAFTDAKLSKKGIFELAEGGTLFLDEIGEMNLLLQAKLLKVVEEKRFRRLGSTLSTQVSTRIIAGTNADLEKRIAEGRFRPDLYYRLNVINIYLPPLRERGTDVLLLAHHFLAYYAEEHSAPAQQFLPDAEELLTNYGWPGNVRELQHVIERVVLLAEGSAIDARAVLEVLHVEPKWPEPLRRSWAGKSVIEIPQEGLSLKEGECRLIEEVLRRTNGNKAAASRILGISRQRLNRKICAYQIIT